MNESTYFVLWFMESERRFLRGETALREAAKKYDFSADDVLRFGAVKFDDDVR